MSDNVVMRTRIVPARVALMADVRPERIAATFSKMKPKAMLIAVERPVTRVRSEIPARTRQTAQKVNA